MSQPLRHTHVRKTYEFIKSHQRQFPVAVMCRVLRITPTGYYAWLKKPTSDHGLEDARLLRLSARPTPRAMAFTVRPGCFSIYARPAKGAASTAWRA
jgi:hypothetical protein